MNGWMPSGCAVAPMILCSVFAKIYYETISSPTARITVAVMRHGASAALKRPLCLFLLLLILQEGNLQQGCVGRAPQEDLLSSPGLPWFGFRPIQGSSSPFPGMAFFSIISYTAEVACAFD